jgi:predicted phage terminase large subunit-like protein
MIAEAEFDFAGVEALEDEVRAQARDSLLLFTQYTYQDPRGYRVNWHHRIIAEALDRFVRGECKRLILAAPPRTGKSELVSLRLPAYIFGRQPNAKVMAASHTDTFARSWGRKIQRLLRTPAYKSVFPNTRLRSQIGAGEFGAAGSDWKETEREFDIVGHGDNYRCFGRGSSPTGAGADFILIDDPYRNRKDASSAKVQAATWEWFNDDLRNRLDSDGGICVMATRWHQGDLTGQLLAEALEDEGGEQWEVISLPAIAEGELHADDPRDDGETLWPWRWAGRRDDLTPKQMEEKAKAVLEEMRRKNPYGFSSLQQQTPTPKTGEFFKPERIAMVKAPSSKLVAIVRSWDKAATEGGGKNTAGVKMALMESGNYCILDCIAGQWSPMRREDNIEDCARLDGKGVKIMIEEEGGSGGKESAQSSVRRLAGYSVRLDRPGGTSGSKEARAEPFSSQIEAGNVEMVEGDWNEAYKNELRYFPLGTFSDRVDASSMAFNYLEGEAEKMRKKTPTTPPRPVHRVSAWNRR